MSLSPVPQNNSIDGKNPMLAMWQAWFGAIQQWLGPIGQHGATTARPTSNLYVGLSYFDSTLGKPVWVKSLGPTVWVDATGGVV